MIKINNKRIYKSWNIKHYLINLNSQKSFFLFVALCLCGSPFSFPAIFVIIVSFHYNFLVILCKVKNITMILKASDFIYAWDRWLDHKERQEPDYQKQKDWQKYLSSVLIGPYSGVEVLLRHIQTINLLCKFK